MPPRYVNINLFINELLKIDDFSMISTHTINEALDRTPTADVVEVVHGKWVPTRKDSDISFCSNCESYWIIRDDAYDYLYCPKCGAKMEVYDAE